MVKIEEAKMQDRLTPSRKLRTNSNTILTDKTSIHFWVLQNTLYLLSTTGAWLWTNTCSYLSANHIACAQLNPSQSNHRTFLTHYIAITESPSQSNKENYASSKGTSSFLDVDIFKWNVHLCNAHSLNSLSLILLLRVEKRN